MNSGAVDTSERSGNGSGFTGQRSPTAKMNVWREARFPRAPRARNRPGANIHLTTRLTGTYGTAFLC